MKSLAKLSAVILPLAMLTACANTAEMEALKASVESAQSTADSALVAARNAQSTADTAQRTATDAELAAMNAQKAADEAQLASLAKRTTDNNLLGLLNMFTGGAFAKVSIMALGIMPYISASIVVQLMGIAVPYLQKLQKDCSFLSLFTLTKY